MRFCEPDKPFTADQQDKLFRFGAIIKGELDRSGQRLALVSRSGLDLGRFDMRYSHAGVSLQASSNTPWSVRQLYYACDEQMPRIYDQGLSSFLLGTNEPALGYVSVVILPPDEAASLEEAVLDNRRALQLLGGTYSANAYPYSLRYQNCNQWLMEMLAAAWGRLEDSGESLRPQAQRWLGEQGYLPSVVDVGWRPLMWLGAFIPWVHSDDHPDQDLARKVYRVSMPASIESFVRTRLPAASRIEFCHTDRHVVVHRGWDAIPEGCLPGPGDTVIPFDAEDAPAPPAP